MRAKDSSFPAARATIVRPGARACGAGRGNGGVCFGEDLPRLLDALAFQGGTYFLDGGLHRGADVPVPRPSFQTLLVPLDRGLDLGQKVPPERTGKMR